MTRTHVRLLQQCDMSDLLKNNNLGSKQSLHAEQAFEFFSLNHFKALSRDCVRRSRKVAHFTASAQLKA